MGRGANHGLSRRSVVTGLAGAAAAATVPSWLRAQPLPRVLVIGAGLAGLHAARRIQAAGYEVTVIEARQRVGGRLQTFRLPLPDGSSGETPATVEHGASIAGQSYRRLLAVAAELGIEPEEHPGGRGKPAFYVGDQIYDGSGWRQLGLTEGESETWLSRLKGSYLAREVPLKGPEDWLSPDFAGLDRISIAELMKQRGASDAAIRLADVRPNCESLHTASALWGLRGMQRAFAGGRGPTLVFPGGVDRIPAGMAAALKHRIHLGLEAKAISLRGDKVRVVCTDGSKLKADYAICTLPFSVLRGLDVDPPFEGAQAEAVAELPYTRITKVVLRATRPFWEEDGQPLSMWTDSPLERLFLIHDHQQAYWGLLAWIDGEGTARIDRMDEAERAAFITAELARVRPSTQGAVEVDHITSWGADPYARGAYHHFRVGQVSRFGRVMARPWRRLHLAGEHTSVTAPGMEGALESGERAADEVLARIRAQEPKPGGLASLAQPLLSRSGRATRGSPGFKPSDRRLLGWRERS